MRIVIDMQGAQTKSRYRGIGRYTLSLAQAIVRSRGEHEIILALSGLFPDTIEAIRAAFYGLLPQENIRIWYAPGPVHEDQPDNDARREVAELIRETFIASLQPDVIHISSLFEGYGDDAITSIGRFDHNTPVSVTLYDLLPLLSADRYFNNNHVYAQHYLRKVEYLKQSAMCLAISETAAREGILLLELDQSNIVNIAPTLDLRQLKADGKVDTQTDEDGRLVLAISECAAGFWDQCASNAIAAFITLAGRKKQPPSLAPAIRRPRLAFVSPLPPERTGIADYSAELLPALAVYYDIELVVAQDRVDVPWVNRYGKIRDVNWLRAHADEIDRVLYHIGNSPFHQYMLPLTREIPGTVVLHDFYLGHLMGWLEHVGAEHLLAKALYAAHGYSAVRDRYIDQEAALYNYPANLDILQHAQGLIVHSEYSRKLAHQYYGNGFADAFKVIPLLRSPAINGDKAAARKHLGIDGDDFVVCSFGFLGATKLNHRLLDCWLSSALAKDKCCQLVFVGENHRNDYGSGLLQTLRKSGLGDRIRITGFASMEMYRLYLVAADIAVQLRTYSRGETSAAVLDCMNYGLPLIVNANGAMAELDPSAVCILPDEFDDGALIVALEKLWRDPERRQTAGERAREIILSQHAPAQCAQYYAETIERFHRHGDAGTKALIRAIAVQKQFVPSNDGLIRLAENISSTLPLMRPAKRLLLDVSATCRNDLKTGIERVARALLLALLQNPPAGYRIEPVYLSDAGGEWHYRYARRYTLNLLDCPPEALDDESAEPGCGDVLLGLDLSGDLLVQAERAGLFSDYRNRGIAVYSVIFDLLPVLMPEVFPPGADEGHAKWLLTISKFDGAICISKTVADELADWQLKAGLDWNDRQPFKIGWFHLGADVAQSSPSQGLPNNVEWMLHQLQARPSFLMVGTIEPRKGYLEAIESFSQLWHDGIDVNLVIVGKEGWKCLPEDMRRDIPKTIEHLHTHPELNNRLLWLEGISDEYLEKVYATSVCLIAASYGEGFGLPLIEAAKYKLPIIARDIPVFREVAGEHAFYFGGFSTRNLAHAILTWLELNQNDKHPKSANMHYLTWRESAASLLNSILNAHQTAT